MSADEPADDIEEKIRIMATDDEKIKSFGEILTNDSSREILQLLFNERLSAAQIAQKTNISLQLARYHLNKLQDLGVVRISKIEKNSKSHDMKIYSATKFSIVIVPPKLSEKTKKSKMLVMSFRHIYKVAGFGIAAGFSGLLSLSALPGRQPTQTVTESTPNSVPENSADSSALVIADEDLTLKDEPKTSDSQLAEPAMPDKSAPPSAEMVKSSSALEESEPITTQNPDMSEIDSRDTMQDSDLVYEDQPTLKDESEISESQSVEPITPDKSAPPSAEMYESSSALEESEPITTQNPDMSGIDSKDTMLDSNLAYDLVANSEPVLSADLFLPLAALTGVLVALTGYYLWRLFRVKAPA